MGSEYFSTIEEALAVFTNEQRAKDFQDFVIAMSFCKKFDPSTFNGTEEAIEAIQAFQKFLKPIKADGAYGDTHTQIRERATSLSNLLKIDKKN